MNVLEKDIAVRVAASDLFTTKPHAVQDFLLNWSNPIAEGAVVAGSEAADNKQRSDDEPAMASQFDPLQKEIFWDVAEGRKEKIETDIQEFLKTRQSEAFDLFLNVMTPGIRHLGDLFGKRKRFIPHLVAAAEAMKCGVKLLEPYFATTGGGGKKGTVIFATVKGDIHDIGKNICVLMLKNFGYEVVDLGRNIPMEDIFKAAREKKAEIIALSALMTTTMVQMKLLVEENKRQGYGFRVMVGGAPVTKEFASEIGADGHSDDVGGIVSETEKVFLALGYKAAEV
jgi:5-methyltetrahydrofolate--homocysteine methyltransferase